MCVDVVVFLALRHFSLIWGFVVMFTEFVVKNDNVQHEVLALNLVVSQYQNYELDTIPP